MCRKINFLFVGLFVLFLAGMVGGEGTVKVLKISEPILLDGSFSEKVWGDAQWYSDFLLEDGSRPTQRSSFALLCDEKNLYLGAKFYEENISLLKVKKRPHDGRVWRDDSIEVFISAGEKTYYFAANALGCQYEDSYSTNLGPSSRVIEWNGPWKVATGKSENFWSVEMQIPWYNFIRDGVLSLPLKIQVARERRAGVKIGMRPEYSAYPKIVGRFGNIAGFATVGNIDVDFSRYAFLVTPPQITTTPSGDKLKVSLVSNIRNIKSPFSKLRLIASLTDSSGETQIKRIPLTLPSGKEKDLSISMMVSSTGNCNLLLLLQTSKAPFITLYHGEFPFKVEYTPVKIILKNPQYRQSIYSTMPDKRISFIIQTHHKGKVLVELRNEKGEILKKEMVSPDKEINWDSSELPFGKYLLVAKLDKRGEDRLCINKFPPSPGSEVWVDKRGFTYVNGKVFFPHGFFSGAHAAGDYAHYASSGFNTFLYYGESVGAPLEKWMEYLDKAKEHGLYMIGMPYPYYRNILEFPDNKFPSSLSPKEKEAIRKWVRERKNHPALLAWYANDEPEMSNFPPELAKDIYETIKEEDPYHPILMLNNTVEGISKYKDGGDILMPDAYPYFTSSGPGDPLRLRASLERVEKENKPAWIVPQAFASRYGMGDSQRGDTTGLAPTFRQARWEAYQALVHKARGILWYRMLTGPVWPTDKCFWFYGYTELCWGMYKGIVPEVSAIARKIFKSYDEKLIYGDKDKLVVGRLFYLPQNEFLLLSYSGKGEEVEASFRLDQIEKRDWYVIAEDRKVSLQGGILRDRFSPYDAHGYSTEPIRNLLSLEKIEQMYREGARIKPPPLAKKELDEINKILPYPE